MLWTKSLLVTPAGAAENVKTGIPSLALTMISLAVAKEKDFF